LLAGLGLAVIFVALAPVLPRAFTDETSVVAAVGTIYPFIVAMQPINALVFVWDGVLLGAEDFRFVAFQMLLSALCAAIVLLLVLPLGWGLEGVWWGIVTLMLVRLITVSLRYRSRRLLSTGT
jgi:MATE family multidrug resistance protein